MRTPEEIYNKAKTWAGIAERGFLEGQNGYWKPDQALLDVLNTATLVSEEEEFFHPHKLSQDALNRATWFCEPLTILLWVLKTRDFPPQDSDVSMYGPLTAAEKLDKEHLEVRSEAECENALQALYWIHRRIYAFLHGQITVDLKAWMASEGLPSETAAEASGLLEFHEEDLKFQEQSLSALTPQELSYDKEFRKVSGSRLSAMRWVLGAELEQCATSGWASPYSLMDTGLCGVEELYEKPECAPAIHRAVYSTDAAALDKIAAPDFEALDLEGMTPLTLAVYQGSQDMTCRLLSKGAAPDFIDGQGQFALFWAIKRMNFHLVPILLDAGAGVDGPAGTEPPIFAVVNQNNDELVELLGQRGCDLNERDLALQTPLMRAADYGMLETAQVLLTREARVDYTDANEHTALHLACRSGHVEMTKLLLEHKAPKETLNSLGLTPMAFAAYRGEEDCALAMLSSGAKPHLVAPNGQTPLHYACRLGKTNLVAKLIELGADVNLASNNNYTPLHAAALSGESAVVSLLVKAGAAVKVADGQGMTPLHTAVNRGELDMTRVLLDADAELEARTEREETVLHVCCFGHHIEKCLPLLLETGADVSALDTDHNTALHLVVPTGKADCVESLLNAGAKTDVENLEGQTPKELAKLYNLDEIVSLLEAL